MKKKEYLKLYYELMDEFPILVGLCYVLKSYPEDRDGVWFWDNDEHPYFKLIYPSVHEYINDCEYWGGKRGEFTALRQNIILLMAAMNGEL